MFYTYIPRLLEYNLVFESHKSIILSTQQLIAGGKRDGTESHNVYQSDVLEQYQWFTEGLFNFASNLLPPVPGIMITGLNPRVKCSPNISKNKVTKNLL